MMLILNIEPGKSENAVFCLFGFESQVQLNPTASICTSTQTYKRVPALQQHVHCTLGTAYT